jgi:hypothetical protein
MRCSSKVLGFGVLLVALFQVPAIGSMIFVGSGDQGREATAVFTVTGNQLEIVLANTSASDVLIPSELLSGVFFALPGNVTLSPTSAALTAGSAVFYGDDGGGNLGGEWAYLAATDIGGFGGPNQGISSAGLGIFGEANFNGSNLFGPSNGAVNGEDYGITTGGDNLATGNQLVTGGVPLTQNSVTFHLTITGSLQESDVGSVVFQYGTALSDPHIVVVPEPSVLLMAATGFVGLLACAGRRRR